VFNSNTPISTHSHSNSLPFIWSYNHTVDRQCSTYTEAKIIPQVCLSPSPFCRLLPWCELRLTVLSDSQVCCCFWAVPPAKFSVTVPSVIHFTSHFKVQMAFSRCNSSTLVPLLGTSFNTILHFSDQIAYLPNVPQHSRWIHQRGWSSPRSPSSTIQSSRTVSPVPGSSIVSVNNDPNWKDTFANPSTNNNITNRPTSSTRSQSKPWQSDNTNEQLAEVLDRLVNTLNANQTPGPNTNSRETKAHIPNTFIGTEPDKLNNFLFQCHLYFHANPAQFDTDIAKINFAMTYLTRVAQN